MNPFTGLFLGAFYYCGLIAIALAFQPQPVCGAVAIAGITCFIAALIMECIFGVEECP